MQTETRDFSDLVIGDKKLGKGGYGDVYEGKWKTDEEKVAVKVMQLYDADKFQREIQILLSLPGHTNIISLRGIAYVGHEVYVITELAVNGSLYDNLHIEKNTPTVEQSLEWASDVAYGMKHLHDHDVIHRDLKSANVLLTSRWWAKVCDFGTARELTHTTTTQCAGTYRWMPPEMMRASSAKVNKKCDLYSYGMILFELFAHKKPYSDIHSDIEVATKVFSGQRPPIPPTLPQYLHKLIKNCWKENPRQRPTFDDFVHKIVSSRTKFMAL